MAASAPWLQGRLRRCTWRRSGRQGRCSSGRAEAGRPSARRLSELKRSPCKRQPTETPNCFRPDEGRSDDRNTGKRDDRRRDISRIEMKVEEQQGADRQGCDQRTAAEGEPGAHLHEASHVLPIVGSRILRNEAYRGSRQTQRRGICEQSHASDGEAVETVLRRSHPARQQDHAGETDRAGKDSNNDDQSRTAEDGCEIAFLPQERAEPSRYLMHAHPLATLSPIALENPPVKIDSLSPEGEPKRRQGWLGRQAAANHSSPTAPDLRQLQGSAVLLGGITQASVVGSADRQRDRRRPQSVRRVSASRTRRRASATRPSRRRATRGATARRARAPRSRDEWLR